MTKTYIGYSNTNNLNSALTDAITKAKNTLHTDYIDWNLDFIKGQDGGFVQIRDLYVGINARKPSEKGLTDIAYFQVRDASESKYSFIVKIVDSENIIHARQILAGEETSKIHLSGTIKKEQVDYNSKWSFHIEPTTIGFFQVSIEVCDATMKFIADNLEDIGGAMLPNNHWCPWSSELVSELSYEEVIQHNTDIGLGKQTN